MADLTSEQLAAVESRGRTIVSASAGSGKTFVMIEKLTRAIEGGADLDSVLAVTFTKKAAAQMKEKLRASLIRKVEGADGEKKAHLKTQISKIPSANISTIHSLCAHILRTYFYALGIDGSFEIISDDDAAAKDLKTRALDNLFDSEYDGEDSDFFHLLKCFSRKRSDHSLRRLVLESYSKVRNVAHYRKSLEEAENLFTDEGFKKICGELSAIAALRYTAIEREIKEFRLTFPETKNKAVYDKIFDEMLAATEYSKTGGIFAAPVAFTVTPKPRDSGEDKAAGELFKKFKSDVSKKFGQTRGEISDEAAERENFLKSGRTAVAFTRLILRFDGEYTAVKRDENKLDYNDLEHLTLELLQDREIRGEINSKYKYVFVDEYQDVNPVQEEIISAVGDEVFLVGDVKQAIYGFRGSKSLFFAEKYNRFEGCGGTALRLSSNFRSTSTVLGFVNGIFSEVMQEDTCGFDYAKTSKMTAGGGYPQDCGSAQIHIFGKDEKVEEERGVYSVMADGRDSKHTREGLAVLQLVERELSSGHYDLSKGGYVDTQPGDICILTRKNRGGSTEGIVRALKDAGYSVSGAQESNVCALPEVKQVLDILSLVDNAEQDIPLATAMLSPLGGFSEDELASIRIAFKREGRVTFRKCCSLYAQSMRNATSQKLNTFFKKLQRLRDLAEILTAGELIDIILGDSGLEAAFSADGGEKLKNVLRLAAEGPKLTLSAFLEKIKAGGYDIKAPASAPADSIKIMTMHAAKGLEFPVVIIADICRTFKGMDYDELPFDDKYGFAPKCYDTENMLFSTTVLRRLAKLRADREELKNELNLFYVACTRAMCKLHIIAEERVEYSRIDALEAKCYAELFDMSRFHAEEMEPRAEIERAAGEVTYIGEPDEKLYAQVAARFMQPYPFADSVELPVKSSASAILKSRDIGEPYYSEHTLFDVEGETGAERGTAYHRFLELCDFSVKTLDGIRRELLNFTESGRLTARQAELLSADELCEIINMPVFSGLDGAYLMREQEFLCRLKACDLLPTAAEDAVLVQGAIDLLARTTDGVRIIDYKYSKKTDEQLVETYSKQLALYRKAVSVILHIPEEEISAAIVNIYRRRQILL